MFVAFDVGNVLFHVDISRFCQELAEATGLTYKEAYDKIASIQALQDCGITEFEKINFGKDNKFQNYVNEIVLHSWNSIVEPSYIMLNFMELLKSDGVKIALLSNMGIDHLRHLRTTYPELFKDNIEHISCEVGARKPTKTFFQSFIMDHSDFKGALYLDDLEDNLKMGKKYTLNTKLFNLEEFAKKSLSEQKKELDNIRLKIINKY